MRRISGFRSIALVLAGLPLIAIALEDTHETRADPLDLPSGPGVRLEETLDLSAEERIQHVAESLRERGHRDLPVLAWALLGHARLTDAPALVERAADLAPESPGVQYEAAVLLHSPAHLERALRELLQSLPGLVWLVTLGGGAVGIGLCVGALLLILVEFAWTVGLHGHALGHLRPATDPPAWPGVLLLLALLAALPIAGIGPVVVLAVAGLLASMQLRPAHSALVALMLALIGVALGPGLDAWARFAAVQGRDPALMAAWRGEHAQSLPGDRELLGRAVESRPDDLLLRVGLATARLREGDLDGVEALLDRLPAAAPPVLRARAQSMRGTVQLARGDAEEAIQTFEAARATHESAAILYNLSQAYGRAVRLTERSVAFAAARELDPDLVSRYTALDSANLHRFLIEDPLPVSLYLAIGTQPGIESAELVRMVRTWTWGWRMPSWVWLVLPLAGVGGIVLRRRDVWRCTRCERVICHRCLPDDLPAGATCVRCARLFARSVQSDPRMRRRQLELDRRHRRIMTGALALLAVAAPGVGRVIEGRPGAGIANFLLLGSGLGLIWISRAFVGPLELGGLGSALPVVGAILLLLPVGLGMYFDLRARLATARTLA